MKTWFDIPGYERFYKISKVGDVKSIKRKIFYYSGWHTIKERILKKCVDLAGYNSVRLNKLGIGRTYRICQLVAMTFYGKRPFGYEVNHKNGIKIDDRIENLEYVTHKENMKHASRYGLIEKGEDRKCAKLKEHEVREIFFLYPSHTQVYLGNKFGVTRKQIDRIVNGHSWKHIH